MKRKPKIQPYQRKISVQDVADYSTPAGAAMANEEMRRIQIGLEGLQAQIEQPKDTTPAIVSVSTSRATPSTDGTTLPEVSEEQEIWALSVKHNQVLLPPEKIVQILDFHDTDYITFVLWNYVTREHNTITPARQVRIRAELDIDKIKEEIEAELPDQDLEVQLQDTTITNPT